MICRCKQGVLKIASCSHPAVEVAACRTGKTHYTPNTGTHVLRQAICNKLEQENGLEYTPAQVVVSNGAKQSIWQAVLAVCSEDDEVSCNSAGWICTTRLLYAKLQLTPPSCMHHQTAILCPTKSCPWVFLQLSCLSACITLKHQYILS